MRVLCVLVPHFRVAVEYQRRPHLQGQPLVIGGYPTERRPVLDRSEEASACGIHTGMSLRQAWSLCPEAVFLPADTCFYDQEFTRFLSLLDVFSPLIEAGIPGCALLSAGQTIEAGRHRVRKRSDAVSPQSVLEAVQDGMGIAVTVGIGEGRFVAQAAARLAERGCVRSVAAGEEAVFLGPLPLSLLPCSEEMQRRLQRFGLRTLAELAALPLGAVQAQFGPEGRRMWELAAGHDQQPLQPRVMAEYLSAEWHFEPAVIRSELLGLAAERRLDELLMVLERRYRETRRLTLSLTLENGDRWQRSWALQEPTHRRDVPLLLLRSTLREVHLSGPVEELRLVLSDLTGETGVQANLFSIKAQRRAGLSAMIEALTARAGRNPIKQVAPLDPRSRIPERRHILVEYRV
ncbi:MAG: DNA polymerase Y family protein [Dehalococcoidia bacterium]